MYYWEKQDLNPLKFYFVSRVNFNKSFKNIEIQVKSEKPSSNSAQNKRIQKKPENLKTR